MTWTEQKVIIIKMTKTPRTTKLMNQDQREAYREEKRATRVRDHKFDIEKVTAEKAKRAATKRAL